MIAWLGIALVGIGVVWQNVFASGAWGLSLTVAGFVVGWVSRQMKFSRTPLDWPLLLLLVTSGISLLITPFFEVTSIQVFRLWSGIAGLYAVVFWTWDQQRFIWFIGGLLVVCAFLSLSSFVIVEWPQTRFFFIPQDLYAAFPLLVSDTVHPNIVASLMVLCVPIPLSLWLILPSKADNRPRLYSAIRLLMIGTFCLVGLVLLLTQSRGGYIAGFIALSVTLWLAGRRKLATGLLLAGLAVGVAILSASEHSEPLRNVVEESVDPSTLAFRFGVWRTALRMVGDFAFTGVGMGTFNDVAPLLYPFQGSQNPGAHNVYLQICVDLGIPGMIGYLSLLGVTVVIALRALGRFVQTEMPVLRALTAGALAGLLGLMVHGLIDNTMWNTRIAFFPWLIIGLIIALGRFAQSGTPYTSVIPSLG